MHTPTKYRVLFSVICLIFIANDLSAQEAPQEQFSNQAPLLIAQQYDIPSDWSVGRLLMGEQGPLPVAPFRD